MIETTHYLISGESRGLKARVLDARDTVYDGLGGCMPRGDAILEPRDFLDPGKGWSP